MFGEKGIMDISGSALSAERRRIALIANNIANVNTTRGEGGEPYKRKYAIFKTLLDNEMGGAGSTNTMNEIGVKIDKIMTDNSPFLRVYDPEHPDANEEGFVQFPNVNIVEEMVDLVAASRAYEANVAVIKATRGLMMKALEILKF